MNKKHGLLFGFAVIAIAAIFTLTGCPTDSDDTGGGNDNTPTVTGVTVTAAGSATSVGKGQTLQFSAAVAGTNDPSQSVTWSITTIGIASGTSISTGGLLTVASGETNTSIEVKATSTLDDTERGLKSVTVTAPPAPTAETFTNTYWNDADYQRYLSFSNDKIELKKQLGGYDRTYGTIENPVFGSATASGDEYTVTYTGTITNEPDYLSNTVAELNTDFPALSGASNLGDEVTFTFTYKGNEIVLGEAEDAVTFTKSE